MRFLLAMVPAAACAAAMFLCFRMMRHSDIPAHEAADRDDVEGLRTEVAHLREEVARARAVPTESSAGGDEGIARLESPDASSDLRP
jgi:hypothetical protein